MNILFVSSGNSKIGISPIVLNQGESLKRQNIELNYVTINGKGVTGYLKNINKLRKTIHRINPDIIHAHYSLSGMLSVLTFSGRPIITSLMGSDVKSCRGLAIFIRVFNRLFWSACILKSQDMMNSMGIKRALVIPNGVDLVKFYITEKQTARKRIGWNVDEKIILFAANTSRREKNFQLAKYSLSLLSSNYNLRSLEDVSNDEMVFYYNAADFILLTSLWEGSPNVIKEAMACNCPIVCTDVGDARWVMGDTEGCFITDFDPEDVAKKINMAIEFSQTKGRTNGRKRIVELGLDSETVAYKIISVYKSIGN